MYHVQHLPNTPIGTLATRRSSLSESEKGNRYDAMSDGTLQNH